MTQHHFKLLFLSIVASCLPAVLLWFGTSTAVAQPTDPAIQAQAIGKAIDVQMDRLLSAIQSGQESRARAYLHQLYPLLADEKNAALDAYVQGAKGGQVRSGKQSCLWSVMETTGYSGYVADGLNLLTLGDISRIHGAVDGTLNNLGNLGLLLSCYDCYSKAADGKLDDSTKSAMMLAVYAKLASHYLKGYGNLLGAAANTGYNLGMWSRKWALSDSEKELLARMHAHWSDRAKTLGGWRKMWVDMWERGGHAEVLRQLQQGGYWEAVDPKRMRNAWAQDTWNPNYKHILGERYFNERVAKILADHVKVLADREREKIIADAQRFLREFPKMEMTLVTTMRFVDDHGQRVNIDPSRVLVGLYAKDQKLLDLPYSTQQTSVKTNLKNFLEALGRADGDFRIDAFYRCRDDSPRRAPAQSPVDDYGEQTGLLRAIADPSGFSFWARIRWESQSQEGSTFRVGKAGNLAVGQTTCAWLGPMEFNFFTLPVSVLVRNAKGQPAPGVTIQGPCGTAKTDPAGRAKMMVLLTDKSVLTLEVAGRDTGDFLILTGSEVLQAPQQVREIRLSANPPKPAPLEGFGAVKASQAAGKAVSTFAAGKTHHAAAVRQVRRSQRSIEHARTNARNAWAAHFAAQLKHINKRYASKPGQSPQAQAANAQAAQKAREALKQKLQPYEQTFTAPTEQLRKHEQELDAVSQELTRRVDDRQAQARAAAKAVEVQANEVSQLLKQLGSLTRAGLRAAQPVQFETLAAVQERRRFLAGQIAQADELRVKLKQKAVALESGIGVLKNELGGLAEIQPAAVGLRNLLSFNVQMGSKLASASLTLNSARACLEAEQPDIAAESLRFADGLLGGVQIRAAADQKLMTEFDAVAKSPPIAIRDPAVEGKALADLGLKLKAVEDARQRAVTMCRRSYGRQLVKAEQNEAWRQAAHNGCGVNAYAVWLEAQQAFDAQPTCRLLVKNTEASEKWRQQLSKLCEEIQARQDRMHKSGWLVREMDLALGKRTSPPASVGELARLTAEAVRLDQRAQTQQKALGATVLKQVVAGFDYDRLLADSRRHAKLIAEALALAGQGNLDGALAKQKQAEAVVAPYEYRRGIVFDVGERHCQRTVTTDWELVLTPDGLRDKDLLFSKIDQLRQASRAKLVVLLEGPAAVKLADVQIALTDSKGRTPGYQVPSQAPGKREFLLDPQTLTVVAKLTGTNITPGPQQITLARNATHTLRFRIEPVLSGGGGNAGGQNATGQAEVKAVKASILCDATFDDSFAPRWTADSKYIVLPGPTRITLANGGKAKLVSALPDPAGPGKPVMNPHPSVNPHILGQQLIYRTVCGGDWLMSLPLGGGKPTRLARTLRPGPSNRETFTLLDVDPGKDKPLLMFLRRVPALGNQPEKLGLWVVPGPLPNVRQGWWVGMLPTNAFEVRVPSAWWRVAYATIPPGGGNRMEWTICNLPAKEQPCQPVAKIPSSASVRRLEFSPNGMFLATVQALPSGQQRGDSVAFRSAEDPAKQEVIAAGAITYGQPGWSPDGRFLGMRAYGQPGVKDGQSKLLVLQVTGQPYQFGTPMVTAIGQGRKTGQGSQPGTDTRDYDTGDDGGKIKPPSDELKRAEQACTDAYNRLTSLMAQGKGNTPDAQKAYAEYQQARRHYEALLQKR